jgi:aminopeptidase N
MFSSESKELSLFEFEDSDAISTYIYGMDAGPFTYVKNDQEFEHVPLGIGIRKSKIKYLDAREFFRIMEGAIRFYIDFFGTPFPFKKYDNIFVPEFRIRGMENVGMINMTDKYFKPKVEVSTSIRFEYLKVLVHELAHMWFGNLVTMKWWNDLWLKESFADYCAGTCLISMAPKFKKSYLNPDQSFLHFQTEAIKEDTLPTTHPVQVQVRDTNEAANVFDKICYRKGACFIRQIAYYIGEDVLKTGMKLYFSKYKMANTEFSDFMNCFQEAAKGSNVELDLMQWLNTWLQTSGINTLTPEVV